MMELTTIQNNHNHTIDSREVAEMLGKQHGDLLKDIQGSGKNLGIIPVLEKGNFPVSEYFIESSYKIAGNNKTYICYLCTKMGCEMLGNKLRGEKGILFTAKYVERFNAMEQQLKTSQQVVLPQDYLSALKALVASEEEKQALALENKQLIQQNNELKPKADYTDTILNNPSLITVTQIAKDYGMTAKEFNLKLNELRVQYKQSGQWFLYAEHQSFGYTHSTTYKGEDKEGKTFTKMNTKWTQKGRLFLYNLLKEHGILPLIEQ